MQTESNHGGKREGSGRPKTYKGETTTISFRVPVNKVKEIKKVVSDLLQKYKATIHSKGE